MTIYFLKKRQCSVVHYKQFIVANATRTKITKTYQNPEQSHRSNLLSL